MSQSSTYSNRPVRAFTAKSGTFAPVLQSPVQICEAFDPQSGAPAPIAQAYIATWDTGATNTVITSKVVTELGLKPSGKVKVRGVGPAGSSQEHDSSTYLVNIFLPNDVVIGGVRVSENAVEGCDVLIGMDVITNGDLAITNHGKTTFSFRVPSCEEIDFVAEIQEHLQRVGGGKPALNPDQQRKLRNKQKAMRKKGR